MGFRLLIKGPKAGLQGILPFDDLGKALAAAEEGIANEYVRYKHTLIWLEPGSCLNVMSDEEAGRTDVETAQVAKSGGLLESERQASVKEDDGFVLHIQFSGMSLPPFVYDTEASVEAAIEHILETRRLRWVFKKDHDYFFVMLGPGVTMVTIPAKQYRELRRNTVAQQMRQQAQQAPRILKPGH